MKLKIHYDRTPFSSSLSILKGPLDTFSIVLACSIIFLIVFNEDHSPILVKVSSTLLPTDNYHHRVLDHSIGLIFNLSNPEPVLNFYNPDSILSKILIPRPPESKNLSDCRTLFTNHFKSLSTKLQVPSQSQLYVNSLESPSYSPTLLSEIETWHLETHSFTDQTPYGVKSFHNQIFTHDPTAPLRVVLAAHIDSKFFPNPPDNQFVGATDSAAPVAIILEVAKALTPLLDKKLAHDIQLGQSGMTSERVTLQILLLDGEEAFINWSAYDSLYGARALAEKWSKPLRTPTATMKKMRSLDQIQTFILYDLLGSPNPTIHSFFQNTAWLFDSFQSAEERLQQKSVFKQLSTLSTSFSNVESQHLRDPNLARNPFFVKRTPGQPTAFGSIEDDHIPFMRQGVPILHLIAAPFPQVWHTIKDDRSALDLQVILEWNLISQVAMVEYLGLESFLDGYTTSRRDEL